MVYHLTWQKTEGIYMKKVVTIILLSIISVYSYEYHTNVGAGLSIAVGEGSSFMRPGPSFSFEPNIKVNKYFGLGGHIDYSWLTVKTGSSKVRAGDHLIDAGLVLKGYAGLSDEVDMFFEIDPAFALDIIYARGSYGGSYSEVEPCFLMTYGTGFQIKKFLVGFKFKHVAHEFLTAKWINFYFGYSGY